MDRIIKVFLLTLIVCFSFLGTSYAFAADGIIQVPEPGSLLLIVTGLLGFGFLKKRFRQ